MNKNTKINVATDCSGIEAPVAALRNMNVSYNHVWSCDNDKFCKQMILSNYTPDMFFDDVLDTNTRKQYFESCKEVDLYIIGFPCQSYSGLALHTETSRQVKINKNSEIIRALLKTIQIVHPKVIVIENVPLFIKQPDYKMVCTTLKRYKYDVYKEILNSKDYGVPQLRKRVYIVAIAHSAPKYSNVSFVYPPPKHTKCPSLLSIIKKAYSKKEIEKYKRTLPSNYVQFLKKFKEETKGHVFVNLHQATRHDKIPVTKEHVGCLTTNCIRSWNFPEKRFATMSELFLLQGFNARMLKRVVSENQLARQIGNSMTVSVLQAIFQCIFDYVNFNKKEKKEK